MKPFSFFLLLILIVTTMTVHLALAQTLIRSSCKNFARSDPNINYNFCKTSLQAAPASRCAPLHGLGTISIRLVWYNITDTRCHIKHLLKTVKLHPYSRRCLNDCLELFSNTIYYVKQTMRDYNAGKFDDANMKMTAVMDASTTCEDGFKEGRGVASPLTKRNRDVFELAAITLSIMRIIQRGSG